MIDTALAAKCNSAGRLLGIFLKLLSANSDNSEAIPLVWVRALSLDVDGAHAQERLHSVSHLMRVCQQELEAARASALDSGIPSELVSQYFNRLGEVISPQHLSARWENSRANLTAENLLFLQWCAFVEPEVGANVSEDDKDSMLQLIRDLEQSLCDERVPKYTRNLLMRYVDGIRIALNDSVVSGAQPLSDAVGTGLHQIKLHTEHIKVDLEKAGASDSGSGIAKRMGALFAKGAQMSGDVDKYAKAFGHGNSLVERFAKLLS